MNLLRFATAIQRSYFSESLYGSKIKNKKRARRNDGRAFGVGERDLVHVECALQSRGIEVSVDGDCAVGYGAERLKNYVSQFERHRSRA